MEAAQPVSKPKHPRNMTVSGLTWERTKDLWGPCWQAIDGNYRVTIDTSKPSSPVAMVYHLDPKYKSFDPSRERVDQECVLNSVWPRGNSLQAIMDDAAKKIRRHREDYGTMFAEAKLIAGSDVKVGMFFHHKGVFRRVKAIDSHEGMGCRASELLLLCPDPVQGDRTHRISRGSVYTLWVPPA